MRSETLFPNTGDTVWVGNSLWLSCRECRARRPIFGAARTRYDKMTEAEHTDLKDRFTCGWVGTATFENACDRPDVFAKGFDWWFQENGEKPFEEVGGVVVDLAHLFFLVHQVRVRASASSSNARRPSLAPRSASFARALST